MSEMELDGKIKLTVPQLRNYLSFMRILVVAHKTRGQFDEASGISEALEELIEALKLPEDWECQMELLEKEEIKKRQEKNDPRFAKTFRGG